MAVPFAIAFFGALGALARFGVTWFAGHRTVSVLPWDTFVVNAIGCLFAGFAVTVLVDRFATPEWLRVGLVVGFLGAFTTFSAFAYDTYDLAVGGSYGPAAANVLGSIGIGLVAVATGIAVGRAA